MTTLKNLKTQRGLYGSRAALSAGAVVFLLSIFIFATAGFAESKRLIRYSDSAGKYFYVAKISDVPEQYRPSATSVLVKTAGEGNNGADEKSEAEEKPSGDGVRVTIPLKFSRTDSGGTRYSGEVKNFLSSDVSEARLTISVVSKIPGEDGTAEVVVRGSKGSGILGPDETAKVYGVLSVDYKSVKTFGYKLTWQSAVTDGGNAGHSEKNGTAAKKNR
ncbi:MAG: hypothetical protein HY280_06875 [Nitrospinae bacterium]|nr:hypothetical protein [Nitrospinota bacterium]